jgi:hypothetical protein
VIKIILKSLVSIPLLAILIIIITVNVRIHYSPNVELSGVDTVREELLTELNGLRSALEKGADVDMQRLYPEGYIFLNGIYSLSWANLAENSKESSPVVEEAHREIQSAWNKINSVTGRSRFHEELMIPYGAFYTGWNNYVLGRKISLEKMEARDKNEITQFQQQCENIRNGIQQNIYPPSYYGSASWPSDVLLCVASLSLHDKLFPAKYDSTIKNWIKKVKKNLDTHGLIPHAAYSKNGIPIQMARGSSQSLMLIFLKEVNDEFATQQFEIYKRLFIDYKFGLTGLREYPIGETGSGDIDSGPVVMGFGAAATIVGVQTFALYNEYNISLKMRNAIEAFGFPFTSHNKKVYLFGQLPMADAFIAFGHSTIVDEKNNPPFVFFHLISFLVFITLATLGWLIIKRPKRRYAKST